MINYVLVNIPSLNNHINCGRPCRWILVEDCFLYRLTDNVSCSKCGDLAPPTVNNGAGLYDDKFINFHNIPRAWEESMCASILQRPKHFMKSPAENLVL